MNMRTTARTAGTLFIIATAAGVLSIVLIGPLDAAQSFSDLSGHKSRITLGALMVIVMAAAIALIPAIMFPVLKEYNEAFALGYVVTRTVEVVLILPAAVGPLLLLAASPPQSTAAPTEPTQFQTLRTLLLGYAGWGSTSAVFFCLSVLILNYLLYRSRLVPRLISGWALGAVVPYFIDDLLVMFGLLNTSSPLHTVLIVPLALNEMVLALWLLTKGFRPQSSEWTTAPSLSPPINTAVRPLPARDRG
jgi:Domain of unknown function (DUF4386)